MKTVAVVPVKGLRLAKGRLAGALSPEERQTLALSMLKHVLQTITASGAIDSIAVISPEPETLALPRHVTPIRQIRDGLNNLLEQGREWAYQERADALLVLFADLPRLASSDLANMRALGGKRGTVVLAPDRHGWGTNAMLAHPPSLARFYFGSDSYNIHMMLAQEFAANVETYRSAGTSFDIDTPDDLARLEDGTVLPGLNYAPDASLFGGSFKG